MTDGLVEEEMVFGLKLVHYFGEVVQCLWTVPQLVMAFQFALNYTPLLVDRQGDLT